MQVVSAGASNRHISSALVVFPADSYLFPFLMTTTIQIREVTFSLRCAGSVDENFLRTLYDQQRSAELEISGLDQLQREHFLELQFRARRLGYTSHYPEASDQIINSESGAPIGRVLVARTENVIHLVDIALLAEQQRQGIGTKIIQALQRECEVRGGELKLQVLKGSPAERLYQRLGFVAVEEDPFRIRMIWAKGLQEAQCDPMQKRQPC